MLLKTCPYCTKVLPFFNLIWQRLSASEKDGLHCPHCRSVISMQGSAGLGLPLGLGGASGWLTGKWLGYSDLSVSTIAISTGVFLLVFILASYFTAPVRDS